MDIEKLRELAASVYGRLCDAGFEIDAAIITMKELQDALSVTEPVTPPADDKWLLYPLPVEFPVTSEFGDPAIPGVRSTIHEGIDFGCPVGVNVMASAAGRVLTAHFNSAYGLRAQIEHEHNGELWQTWYCHLSMLRVVPGQSVIAGQSVGQSGATGNVTGPHLHFNVQYMSDMGMVDKNLVSVLHGCRNPRLYVRFP